MQNSANSMFHIPNYNQPEPIKENFKEAEKPHSNQKQKNPTNEKYILEDLLKKSQEITKARAEAANFLRGMN